MSSTPKSRPELDLTNTSCPMAFVKARIYLDQRKNAEIIQILYEDTPANEPLVRSIQSLGHILVREQIDQENKKLTTTASHTPDRSRSDTLQLKRISIQVKK